MKRIFRYTLTICTKQSIVMSKNAKILHVNEYQGNICIWAEFDPLSIDLIVRMFEVFGTGEDIYEDMGTVRKYIGTVKLHNFNVFHIYERIN